MKNQNHGERAKKYFLAIKRRDLNFHAHLIGNN